MLRNSLNVCQSGFRKNHSTVTTLLDVQDFILNNTDKGYVTAALFLDLKKAFDTVNHELLINKLNSLGIKGNELNWFVSYLNNRVQAVNIGHSMSNFQGIKVGVLQGSILGPLLFIIYVNDLPLCVDCKTVMYADDTTLLFCSSDQVSLQIDLNSNLNRIAQWFNRNKLTLNIKKTKLMLFGTTKNLDKFKNVSLKYNNNAIERVDSFKYLGVIFDSHMTWLHHVDHISSNVSKRCGIVRRIKYYLPVCTLKMLAEAMIIPDFDYCSPVWSNCNKDLRSKMQIQHNKVARILLSADIRTPVDDLMNSLKWLRLSDRWSNQMLLVTFKCVNGTAPSYLSNFQFTHSVHNYSTRCQISNTIVVPKFKSNAMFHVRASHLWNNLPSNIRINFDAMSINQFKNSAFIQC